MVAMLCAFDTLITDTNQCFPGIVASAEQLPSCTESQCSVIPDASGTALDETTEWNTNYRQVNIVAYR